MTPASQGGGRTPHDQQRSSPVSQRQRESFENLEIWLKKSMLCFSLL
jgi:hypothetical protein